jgi:hypothetical protein
MLFFFLLVFSLEGNVEFYCNQGMPFSDNIRYVYKIAEKISHQKHFRANMTIGEVIAL